MDSYSHPQNRSHQSHTQNPSHPSHTHRPPPSSSDLLSSAKVVAEAARSTLRHDTAKIDSAKVAGAADDLLAAASHYGKLEEKSFGKYVEKAENYLHQYETTQHSTHPTAGAEAGHSSSTHPHPTAGAEAGHSSPAHSSAKPHSEGGFGDYIKMAETFTSSTHSGAKPHSEGGFGDYIKMAETFTSSTHSSTNGPSEGGFGDYMKMAEGFLKKH